jgi:hypothetical protein
MQRILIIKALRIYKYQKKPSRFLPFLPVIASENIKSLFPLRFESGPGKGFILQKRSDFSSCL